MASEPMTSSSLLYPWLPGEAASGNHHARGAWTGAHDIRLMAEHLDVRHFKALSYGLGIGSVRPLGTGPQRRRQPEPGFDGEGRYVVNEASTPLKSSSKGGAGSQVSTKARSTVHFDPQFIPSLSDTSVATEGSAGGRAHAASSEFQSATASSAARPRMKMPWSRRCLSWSLDFLFVASFACVTVVGAAAATAWKAKGLASFSDAHGVSGITAWLELRPFKLIAAAPAWAPLAGIWGLYALYLGVFRLTVGFTIGDLLAGTRRGRSGGLPAARRS